MPNRPVHFEFYSTDPAASVEFFTEAFGWRFQQWDDNPYWLAFTGPDGDGIDGAVAPAPEDRGPHTLNTITVDVLEEAVAAAGRAGGAAVTDVIDITGVGRWIQIREPGGNIFGLMQGYHADPPQEQPATT